jgi:hypothetical protein
MEYTEEDPDDDEYEEDVEDEREKTAIPESLGAIVILSNDRNHFIRLLKK